MPKGQTVPLAVLACGLLLGIYTQRIDQLAIDQRGAEQAEGRCFWPNVAQYQRESTTQDAWRRNRTAGGEVHNHGCKTGVVVAALILRRLLAAVAAHKSERAAPAVPVRAED